ncbi:hypothetical protein RI129_007955 [Pyrocoelia pectoralis]|uniref:Uncharacterized protein n=1 Tax=Pyrocoelia pectoralis TaxID=417401 RepID=A0AAN7V8W0_9COLE
MNLEPTTSSNRSQTSPVSDILHYKCPLVKLVRQQINSLDDYEFTLQDDDGENASRCNPEALEQFPTSANKTNQILALFLISLSAAFTFIYGAYKGAEICSGAPGGKCNVCYAVNPDLSKIPGLMSFHKSRSTY